MTDSEIIKAKAHFEYGIKCDIFQEPVLSYAKTVLEAFDELSRQKAEIEQHKNTIAEIQSEISILRDANENLQGMYLREKTRVEKSKEKCIYFSG